MFAWKRPASLLFSLLAAGCAAAQPTAPPAEEPQVSKQQGGVLQAASNAEPTGLYWADGVSGTGGHRTSLTPAFENLVTYQFTRMGEDVASRGIAGHLAPGLAETWDQGDPKTYTFTLRRGVKWHDGEPFTAKDVLWTIERWGDPPAGADLKTIARNIERVENPAPDTIRIRLKDIDVAFLSRLADYTPKMLPAHPAERAGVMGDALRELYNKTAIGTGPFKVRAHTRTKSFELERFEGHWSGGPYLDGMRILYGLDRSTQNAAFIAGELDFISINDKVQFDLMEQTVPGTQKIAYLGDNTPGVAMNQRREPLNDVRVRRAIQLAMDRQKMVDIVTFGEGSVSPPPPVIVGLAAQGVGMKPEEYMQLPGWRQPKDQDIAEARRLLAQAGVAPGLKLSLKYRTAGGTPYLLAQPVAAALKEIGIEAVIVPQDDAIYNQQVIREMDFELNPTVSGAGAITAESAYTQWFSTSPGNISGVNDPELDRLILQANGETDPARRNELFTRMQQIMVEKVYFIPLFNTVTFQALQPWVHDFFGSFSSSVSIMNSGATWFEVDRMPNGRKKL